MEFNLKVKYEVIEYFRIETVSPALIPYEHVFFLIEGSKITNLVGPVLRGKLAVNKLGKLFMRKINYM